MTEHYPVVRRHIDEIDATKAAKAWIKEVADSFTAKAFLQMEYYGLTYNGEQPTNGGIINLWFREKLIAQAVLVRDSLNWTVLTMMRFGDDAKVLEKALERDMSDLREL